MCSLRSTGKHIPTLTTHDSPLTTRRAGPIIRASRILMYGFSPVLTAPAFGACHIWRVITAQKTWHYEQSRLQRNGKCPDGRKVQAGPRTFFSRGGRTPRFRFHQFLALVLIPACGSCTLMWIWVNWLISFEKAPPKAGLFSFSGT